jgi:hypothetical protein
MVFPASRNVISVRNFVGEGGFNLASVDQYSFLRRPNRLVNFLDSLYRNREIERNT